MHFHSPLRYPGGKARISKYIMKLIEKNNLNDAVYIEPFAGGGGLALNLLYNEYVSKIILNDLNKSIFSFWYSTLNYNEEFCKMIRNTPINIEEWEKQKKIQKKKENANLLDLGFSTFFLNRTNRSGIIDGGVIGGTGQNGKWKIDARFNKDELIKRIELVYQYADRIEIFNLEAMHFIREISKKNSRKSLFFIDPPYYEKGRYLYENYYISRDHEKLYEVVSNIKNSWIVTYDKNQKISEMYSAYRQKEYTLNYSVSDNKKGVEIMIFSPDLSIPYKKVT